MCDSTEPWKWEKSDLQKYKILSDAIIKKTIISYEKVSQRGGGANLFSYLYFVYKKQQKIGFHKPPGWGVTFL